MSSRAAIALWLFALGCGVSPIRGKIEPGSDAFVIGVGEGSDGNTDLFAAPANGGAFHRLTFSQAAESAPILDSTGTSVAFFRRYRDGKVEIVRLNLTTMSEARRTIPAPGDAARLAWLGGADSVALVGPSDTGAPGILLGEPAFARVARCPSGPGWCVRTAQGDTPLPEGAEEPLRWGPNAVAYRLGDALEIRPLEGGRTRQITWTNRPQNLRQLTHNAGTARR